MLRSLYRKPLASSCISFYSEEGKRIFKSAMQNSYMESYFGLANNFLTQSEPAYCGLGCLTMVLNALEVDPQRKWKGIWRWYSEEMLDCCKPLDRVKENGITFHEFACLGRCNGLNVQKFQATKTTKNHFLESIMNASSRSDQVLVVSYSRATLGQTGDGHYSPIGGYDPQSNTALVMDVARFKYPSYWVSIDLLWEALFPIDKETQEPRGYFLIEKSKSMLSLSLLRLEMDWRGWASFSNRGILKMVSTPKIKELHSVDEFIPFIIQNFMASLAQLNFRPPPLENESHPEIGRQFSEEVHSLLHEVSHHHFYTLVENQFKNSLADSSFTESGERLQKQIQHHLDGKLENCIGETPINVRAALSTIFILALPQYLFKTLHPSLQEEMMTYTDPKKLPDSLRDEVAKIKKQIETMTDMSSTCGDCNCYE